jgi:MtrB/PioB family decaheme-associated outer membrane protein
MKTSTQRPGLSRASVALAVALAFGPARAQEGGGLAPLATAPVSAISVGVGVATGDEKDRARFGLFNGLRTHDVTGLLGFGYYNRDAVSGRWMSLEGRNLGLDNRELGYSYRRLGDLKFNVDYNEITRHDPRTINTSLVGAGTTTPTVSLLATPRTGQDLNLELKRKSIGLIVEKQFGSYQLEVNFKNEDKDGARFWGRGFACSASWVTAGACTTAGPAAILMLPEPVNSTIRQLDLKLNYSGEKLRLSGGYYGSFYTNSNGTLRPTITGTLGNQNLGSTATQAADPLFYNTMSLPMALWADNQAHQLFLAGNYAITPKTRMTFKYAYTKATQNESFAGMGLTGAPAGRSDLGGEIDTTKAQVGISAHPLEKLHVHGDLAFESKKNKTPLAYYNIFGGTATPTAANTFTNGNQSSEKYDAKLEANYRLPANVQLIGGMQYEHEDFGTFTPTEVAGGISGLRQEMEETTFRVELRKSMSETFTGSVSYVSSRKKGDSPWLKPLSLPSTGVIETSPDCLSVGANACIYSRTAIFPFIYMDREREKLRLTGNWMPTEKLSLQLFWDDGTDRFHGPTEHGLRVTRMGNYAVDVGYVMSDAWKLNAYTSYGRQSRDSGHSTGYDALVTDRAISLGAGIAGKATGRLQVGADLLWIQDKLLYSQTADAAASPTNVALLANTGGLPDVTYKLLQLKLYGEYALQKNAYLRLDMIHYRSFFNEWTYNFNGTPYLYSDNTTLGAKERQIVTFVGASYIFKFM